MANRKSRKGTNRNTKLINGRRPLNKRAERALLKREPKVFEDPKVALFIRGHRTSDTINKVLQDLYLLKQPFGIHFRRKHEKRPFEDITQIEFLSEKNDASLFMYGSNTKKRPNNLVVGRLFDHHILDMIELGVERFKPTSAFERGWEIGAKPCFIFRGVDFEYKEEYRKFSNIIVDFFRGTVLSEMNVEALSTVIICTAVEGVIYFRHYLVHLKRVEGSKLPLVQLEECGPSLNFKIRRYQFGSKDLMKEAHKIPREAQPTKVKNVTTDVIGKHIRVHKGRQDFEEIQTRKMKGLKRQRSDRLRAEKMAAQSPSPSDLQQHPPPQSQPQQEQEQQPQKFPSQPPQKRRRKKKKGQGPKKKLRPLQ